MSEYNHANSMFGAYEQWHQLQEDVRGLEVTSLTDSEYARAMEDPRTAALPVRDSAGLEFDVPVATPVENLEWYNQRYFRKAAVAAGLEADAPIVYYDHLPSLVEGDNRPDFIDAVAPLLGRVAQARGLLVTDHLDVNASQVLGELTGTLQELHIAGTDILPAFDPEPFHFNYASPATLANPDKVQRPAMGLWDAYQSGVQLQEGISLEQSVGEADGETVWQYYKERFDNLTAVDPMEVSSSKEELLTMFHDERVLKIVSRLGGDIVSMALYGDVRAFPWANQHYYRQHFPEAYDQGDVWFFPGAITKAHSGGSIRPVLSAIGTVAEAAGVEQPVISFVCNKLSNKPITTISNWALNRSGLVVDTTKLVSKRIFHAYQLRPESA